MNTKLYILLFTLLAVLVSCERTDPQEEVSYAVVSGKKVKSIGSSKFIYDELGRVIKITYIGNPEKERNFLYEEDRVVKITDTDGRAWMYTYNEEGNLCESVTTLSSYNGVQDYISTVCRYYYNAGFLSSITVDFSDMEDYVVSYYWVEGDILYFENTNNENWPIVCTSSKIVNNFNISFAGLLPDLLPGPCVNEFMFADGMIPMHLMSTVNYGGESPESINKTFTYERNSDGDICRVCLNSSIEEVYWDIEYYD